MLKYRRLLLITFMIVSFLYSSEDLHPFIQQITEESVRDYYYRAEDPSWDHLKFHQDKNREEGSGGHDSAKAYIEATLKSYLGNNNVYIDEFPWADGTNGKGYNIIGVKKGRLGSNSDVWIVGAHYDSYDMDRTGTAPGANDNGSGIVGVLEMARVINTRESDATIIFAFWDAEEPRYSTHSWVSASSFGSDSYSGPSGSRAWVNDHVTTDAGSATGNVFLWDRIKGNINLDMFGFPAFNHTLWLYHGGSAWNGSIDESGSIYPLSEDVNNLYNAAVAYLQTYGYDDQIPKNYITVVGKGTMQYSDNISFSRAGIPSLEYAESDWNSDIHYHKWSDYYRPGSGDENYSDENPQIKMITMTIRGALALLADTAKISITSDTPMPVNLTGFRAMSSEGCVLLTWETASEIENLGYLIERRQSYDRPWESISSYLEDHALTGKGHKTSLSEYCWIDENATLGQHYEYRLSDVDFKGNIHPLKTTSVLYRGDLEKIKTALPGKAYPNPFNPFVRIEYLLPENAIASVSVYDMKGQLIKTLVENVYETKGFHQVGWDAMGMSSGLYLIKISTVFEDKLQNSCVMKIMLQK